MTKGPFGVEICLGISATNPTIRLPSLASIARAGTAPGNVSRHFT
jgi:hypothetical protein